MRIDGGYYIILLFAPQGGYGEHGISCIGGPSHASCRLPTCGAFRGNGAPASGRATWASCAGRPAYPPAKQPEGAAMRGALNAEESEIGRRGGASLRRSRRHRSDFRLCESRKDLRVSATPPSPCSAKAILLLRRRKPPLARRSRQSHERSEGIACRLGVLACGNTFCRGECLVTFD